MTLQTRLSIAFTAIAALSVAATLLVALPIYDRQAHKSADDFLALSAKTAQAMIEQDTVRVHADAEELASRPEIKIALEPGGEGLLPRALLALREQMHEDYLAVARPDGSIVGQDPATEQSNLSGYATLASASDGRAIATIEKDERGNLRMQAAAPIIFNNKTIGVVLTATSLDSRIAEQLRIATGLQVAFLSGQQVQASSLSGLQSEDSQGQLILIDPKLIRETADRKTVFARRRIAGDEYQMVFAPLEGPVNQVVGTIAMGMPVSQIEIGQNEVYQPVLLVVLVVIACAWILGIRIAKRIATPVQRVAAEMVAYDDRVSAIATSGTSTGSEADRIAFAFHDLQKRLALMEETFSEERKVMESLFQRLSSGTILTDPAFNPVFVKVGQLEVDKTQHHVRMQGNEIVLTPTEFDLLWLLALNAGKVFTREELIDQIWGSDYAAEPSMIDVHVSNLRRKLEPDPAKPEYILTVRGVGYRMRKIG